MDWLGGSPTSRSIGWVLGMAGRPQMALFVGLAIGASSWLRAQLKLLVQGLAFPPCEPPWKPSWAFSQYGGRVPRRSVPYKEAEAEDLSSFSCRYCHILLVRNRSWGQSKFACQWEQWQDHMANGHVGWEIVLRPALETYSTIVKTCLSPPYPHLCGFPSHFPHILDFESIP